MPIANLIRNLRQRTGSRLGRRTPPGRRVRAGGLCDFPAANSFAPAGGRHVTQSDSQRASSARGTAGGDDHPPPPLSSNPMIIQQAETDQQIAATYEVMRQLR